IGFVAAVANVPVPGLQNLAGQIHPGIELALHHPDVVFGAAFVEACEHHLRVESHRPLDRLLPGRRNVRDLARLLQIARHLADEAGVGCTGYLEITLGTDEIRPGARETRLRLRNVGSGHLADGEAILRSLELAL